MTRPRFYDFHICPLCGLEFDRRSEWEMMQVENHRCNEKETK